ncbi:MULTISPECIES: hypothetical protein [Corallococcus]|uniref:hypothetical protein n=1 Tax=Corallococcus TaxID=83461 RepID=UPI0011C38338|nr:MULTISPECIES: hypothetical protein [Corallococcus]
MPNLETLLNDTLLLTAAPDAPWKSYGASPGALEAAAADPGTPGRWNWSHDVRKPGRVSGVTYHLLRTPWYVEQTPTVLEELLWHPIEVGYRGLPLTLELTKKFLVRKYETSRGTVAKGQSAHWLPAELDRSMLLVFGFQLNLRAKSKTFSLEPIPLDVMERDDFMPRPGAKPPKAPVMKVTRTETGTLQLVPLRVLVCAEFVCCQESTDYVPGAKARTSRFRPHLMLMSNRPLERLAAKISIRRPSMSTMAHEGLPPADDQDGMSHMMATGMWSDSNSPEIAWEKIFTVSIPPVWSSIFSRFKTNLPAGAGYLMASPDAPGGPGFLSHRWNDAAGRYEQHQEELMPGQGYFDNIHVAPPMRAPKTLRDLYPDAKLNLEEIVMAPFCIHDCLHQHWRWLPAKEKSLHGWDEKGPYAVPGAPHIPLHQHLRVEVESPHAYAYCVRSEQVLEPGRWEYILHEGLAYGISASHDVMGKMLLGGRALLSPWPSEAQASWAMFYWVLRYSRTRDRAVERLLEDGAPVP